MKAPLVAVAVLSSTGCFLAAAGAGAGGGIYFTQRGVESVVAAPVERASAATEQTFRQLGIRQTKTAAEQEGGQDKREIEGATTDREVAVTLTSENSSGAGRGPGQAGDRGRHNGPGSRGHAHLRSPRLHPRSGRREEERGYLGQEIGR